MELRDRAFKTAIIGLLLVAPTIYFVSAAFLNEAGISVFFQPVEALSRDPVAWPIFNHVISPILFMGLPILALFLNLGQVVRLGGHAEAGAVTASVTVLRKPWNLTAAGLCLLMLFVLSAYLVGENWRCWVGILERC